MEQKEPAKSKAMLNEGLMETLIEYLKKLAAEEVNTALAEVLDAAGGKQETFGDWVMVGTCPICGGPWWAKPNADGARPLTERSCTCLRLA